MKVAHDRSAHDPRAGRAPRPTVIAGLLVVAGVLWLLTRSGESDWAVGGADSALRPSGQEPQPSELPAAPRAAAGGGASPLRLTGAALAGNVEAGAPRAISPQAIDELVVPGLVVDERGNPVAGATVWMTSLSAKDARCAASTDEKGRIALHGLSRGDWMVSARAEGFVGADSFDATIRHDGHDELLICLSRTATLAGTALLPDGRVPPQASVSALLIDPRPASPPPATQASIVVVSSPGQDGTTAGLDGAGRFTLSGLAPGRYLVAAFSASIQGVQRLRNGAPASAEPVASGAPPAGVVDVVLSAGETRSLDLELPSVAAVRGRLLCGADAARGGAVVALARDPDTGFHASAPCDGAGTYELQDLPVGTYDLLAAASGEPALCRRPVALIDSETAIVNFVFAGPELAGTVVDAASLRPVPGLTVVALPATPLVPDAPEQERATLLALDWRKLHFDPSVKSDADGRFAIPRMLPGHYRVSAQGDGWLPGAPVDVALEAGALAPEGLVVKVAAGTIIEGTARFTSGELVGRSPRDWEASVWEPGGHRPFRVVPVREGAFRFATLPPGTYELRVRDPFPWPERAFSIRTVVLRGGDVQRVDALIDDG